MNEKTSFYFGKDNILKTSEDDKFILIGIPENSKFSGYCIWLEKRHCDFDNFTCTIPNSFHYQLNKRVKDNGKWVSVSSVNVLSSELPLIFNQGG